MKTKVTMIFLVSKIFWAGDSLKKFLGWRYVGARRHRRREAAAAPIFDRIYDMEAAAAWWRRRRRRRRRRRQQRRHGGGEWFFLVFKNFCENFTVTNATRIPLGPQRGNWRTHQGGPSPRQPDVVEAQEKISLPPPGPQSRGKNCFHRVDREEYRLA